MGYLLGGILGAGTLGLVIYWLRRAYQNSVALDQRDAALQVERERIASLEKAAAAARAARAKELDEKTAAVHTGSDAAELLRGSLTRPR